MVTFLWQNVSFHRPLAKMLCRSARDLECFAISCSEMLIHAFVTFLNPRVLFIFIHSYSFLCEFFLYSRGIRLILAAGTSVI